MKSRLTILVGAAVLVAVSLASCRKVSLSALTGRIDSLVVELADIKGQIEGIGTTIADLQAAVEALQAASDSTSSQILAAITALESRIAALEQLRESLATKEWVEGTFATLAAQQQTAAALAELEATVRAALAGMPEGKTVIEAIAEAAQSVKDWVSEQLSGYYTVGEIDGRLNAMKSALEARIAALGDKADSLDASLSAKIAAANADIAALGTALNAAKAEITTSYTAAINAAKTELDGKITANTTAINAANTRINTLEGKVSALETAVADLEAKFNAFADSVRTMVQSVVFVPRYQGGCAVVKSLPEVNSFTLDYEVLPRKTGKAIADSWSGDKSILKMTYRQVATRAGLPTLDIKNVAFDASDSLLNVTVSLVNAAEIFLSKDKSVAVSLEIYTDATMVSSPFTDIDFEETANCYIVKEAGEYKFNATVKGNGWNTDGTIADPIAPSSAKVLWESFGTNETPVAGDLVKDVAFDSGSGYVKFTATDKKGNAVIAAVDGDGKILWSWHIWLAGEQPQGQVYNNGAGTMMDRNLGATSATPSDGAKTFGLLYQWGRKDPFLGSSAIDSGNDDSKTAKSVTASDVTWNNMSAPKTPAESVAIPTTFIITRSSPYDWTTRDDALWGSAKTMYDPCPPGYRVPDGGDTGVWYKAFSSASWTTANNWDGTYKGMDFGRTDKPLGSGMIWYPAAGYRYYYNGTLNSVGNYGFYWSCTEDNAYAHDLFIAYNGTVNPFNSQSRAEGYPVRCLSE